MNNKTKASTLWMLRVRANIGTKKSS